ncbi:MAG: amidohydrolase family protein [Planktomarina sp.]|nr:amidohydrolase family protein [Planktomarina sp.]
MAATAEVSLRKAGRSQLPILGIASHADLCLGVGVSEVLDAHRIAANGLLRAIRHSAAYCPAPPAVDRCAGPIELLLLRKDFRQGFAEIAPAGLTFDAWLLHPQIRDLTELARAFLDTTIIFDHFGGPLGIGPHEGKQAAIFLQWQRDIFELARCKNVVAKLGGLAMMINGWGWDTRDSPATSDEIVASHEGDYLHMIDCLGPAGCMFESSSSGR